MGKKEGEFQKISKYTLTRSNFQRELNEKYAKKLAKTYDDFSWEKFGTLSISKRIWQGDALSLMDGQHRWFLAMGFEEIITLPCMIYQTNSEEEEARIWYEISQSSRKPTWYDKWHVLLAMNDKATLFGQKLIDQSGRKVGKSSAGGSKTVTCLSSMHLRALTMPKILEEVWMPIIIPLCKGDKIPQRINEGICYLQANLASGESLLDEKWKKRIFDIGLNDLKKETYNAGERFGVHNAKSWAKGILERLNRGVKEKNQLELKSKRK